MLAWFDAMSLRWKLTTVLVLASVMTVLVASVVMGVIDTRAYHAQAIGNSTAEAEVLAASVTASLVFDDTSAAKEYLAALAADVGVDAAAVYGADGAQIANYLRPGRDSGPLPQSAGTPGAYIDHGELAVVVPVMEEGRVIGMVYIRDRVATAWARFARTAGILLGIGAAALAVVLPLSLWLHRKISNPIEELAARNAIIQATLDSVDHGVVVVDADLSVTFLNEHMAGVFGAAGPALRTGMNFEGFLRDWHDAIRAPFYGREADLSRLRAPGAARGQYPLPDGRTVEYRQSPLPRGGFVRTFTDISEEKALQDQLQTAKVKAEQAAMAKAQFLAAMSHEIRTPMNGVIGIVELLHATTLTPEQKQMVEIIRQSGVTLLDVINDILDYSKIEAGRMTVEITECPLGEIVETTATVVGGHTSSKFLDIVGRVDPAIDAVVMGDPVRVRQVILNLMGNAIKFTQKGLVSVEATLERSSDDEQVVLFEITDTGMGVSEEKQKQLFQPFTQADYSTTRRFGGTGLGLSICRNLVELMGGEIGLESKIGQGSRFWFRLKFQRLAANLRTDPFAPYRSVLAGLRVMVCDATVARSPISVYLRTADVDVVEGHGVLPAIALLQAERSAGRPVDIVVVAVRIGEDNALALADELQRHPALLGTKIMLVVPHLSASSARLATTRLFSSSVSAPLQRAKFYDAIAAAAGRAAQPIAGADETLLHFIAPAVEDALANQALILVAEDNQTNQFVVKSQLHRLGYAAEFVSDGREAWEVLTREPDRYHMLITDCHMPFIDGYQLTGMIRERELAAGQPRLPVVALTANALEGESEICRAAGMDGYMFKPTNLPTLDAMVQKWLPAAAKVRRPAAAADEPARARSAGKADAPGPPASKSPASEVTPVDLAALGRLLGNADPRGLQNMLEMYWESEAETPVALRKVAAARDPKALASAAHGAKGAASSVGARKLAELCKALELAAKDENWDQVGRLMPEVEDGYAEVGAFITRSQQPAEVA